MSSIRLGVDRLGEELDVRGKRIGLVANHTSISSTFNHLIDVVRKIGGDIEVVFTPEHGLSGAAGPGERIESYRDPDYEVQVFSLYGELLRPPRDILEGLDLLIYDVQDVGARWYTYISTLYLVLEEAAKASVPLIVLDRPNPVTGLHVEGPVLRDEYRSFVGMAPIPVRYGLTPGELALYYSRVLGLGGEVRVVRMDGWKRALWFDETGLPWVPPSPNIPNPDTALAYIGTCLFEAVNVSEGRGTPYPFVQIGAPWIRPKELVEVLSVYGLEGVRLRPLYFKPCCGEYSGEVCGGIFLHISDRSAFRPFSFAVRVLIVLRELYGDKLELLRGERGYRLDFLAGTDRVRKVVMGEEEANSALRDWQRGDTSFLRRARRVLLYS